MTTAGPGEGAVYLWDLPVRLTHWGFAILLPAMWWTAEEGMMDRHQQLGLVFLFLLALRILWGFFGSAPARFSQFVRGPRAVIGYLRGAASSPPTLGHNPLGAVSVVLILAVLAIQIGLGLVAQDVDGLFSGPLNHLVSYDTGDAARGWHELNFNLLAALVAVHIAAIFYYWLVRGDNLIAPMVSGRKPTASAVDQPRRGGTAALLFCLAAAAALMSWIWFGAPPLGD